RRPARWQSRPWAGRFPNSRGCRSTLQASVRSSRAEFALELHDAARLRQRNRAEPHFFAPLKAGAVAARVECVGGGGDAIQAAEFVAEAVEADHAARLDTRVAERVARSGQAIVQPREQLGQDAAGGRRVSGWFD